MYVMDGEGGSLIYPYMHLNPIHHEKYFAIVGKNISGAAAAEIFAQLQTIWFPFHPPLSRPWLGSTGLNNYIKQYKCNPI